MCRWLRGRRGQHGVLTEASVSGRELFSWKRGHTDPSPWTIHLQRPWVGMGAFGARPVDGEERKDRPCPRETRSLWGTRLRSCRRCHTCTHTGTHVHTGLLMQAHTCTQTHARSSERRPSQKANLFGSKPPRPPSSHLPTPPCADLPLPGRLPAEREEAQTPCVSTQTSLPRQESSSWGQMPPVSTLS